MLCSLPHKPLNCQNNREVEFYTLPSDLFKTPPSRLRRATSLVRGRLISFSTEHKNCKQDLLIFNYNPSVSLTADSSLYTREPLKCLTSFILLLFGGGSKPPPYSI